MSASSHSQVARTEFAAAIAQIASERNIPAESIYEAIKAAMISAYRREAGISDDEADIYYFVNLDEMTGEAHIFAAPVTEHDVDGNPISWDAKKAQDVTPAGFGRIAAQTAKQVILQKIRESERDQIISDFQNKIGEIITGTVLRMEGRMVVLDLGRGYAYMPPEEQMRGEFYRMNSRVTVLIKDIRETFKGRRVIVSRADKDLVSKLFEREVPEIASGAVGIVAIAREAGVRTKLAVRATQEGVDPVGSCVGQRGVRVQEVIKELNNEKIDIIPFNENERLYIQAALAPAEALLIEINEKRDKVVVTAPDDQLSLAIGRGGQNVRLAAKLLDRKITIKSASGKVEKEMAGTEEYEIDTFVGLAAETRELLVSLKLTTVFDLERFRDKWEHAEEVTTEQKELVNAAISQARQDEAIFFNDSTARKIAALDSDTVSSDETGEDNDHVEKTTD